MSNNLSIHRLLTDNELPPAIVNHNFYILVHVVQERSCHCLGLPYLLASPYTGTVSEYESHPEMDGEYINHYENLPMQYIENFSPVKIENFIGFLKIFFLFSLKT